MSLVKGYVASLIRNSKTLPLLHMPSLFSFLSFPLPFLFMSIIPASSSTLFLLVPIVAQPALSCPPHPFGVENAIPFPNPISSHIPGYPTPALSLHTLASLRLLLARHQPPSPFPSSKLPPVEGIAAKIYRRASTH